MEEQWKYLVNLLQKLEELFDGTLGTWKTYPLALKLKKSKPICFRPYAVPNVYK